MSEMKRHSRQGKRVYMALPGEKHKKGEKCGCISRGCHLFLSGLGRTRPALWGLSQLEMSASVPYTKSLSLGLYLCGGQNISSNYSSFLSSSWVATQGHAALSHLFIRTPQVHLCGLTASSLCFLGKAILGKPNMLLWTTCLCPFKIHIQKP